MKKRFLSLFTLLLTFIATVRSDVPVDTLSRTNSANIPGYEEMKRIVRNLDRIDTAFIEPQRYEFTVMLQATHAYDRYSLSSVGHNAQSVSLAPDRGIKVGPYFGWRWLFAGYTFELKNINPKKIKQEFDFSIYSSKIGVDLFFRRTGNDYKLRSVYLGDGINTSRLKNAPFSGLKAGITGFNAYYIFNHRRFSYPAAFAQSTIQKVSCGSWMAGVGYTHNSLSFKDDVLQQLIDNRLGASAVPLDSGLMFRSAEYNDFNISGGYAYNWVFARHWLLAASLQAAVAYKQSKGDAVKSEERDFDFYFRNMNIDGIGRFGLVYNNMRWFVGASVIVHTNNFHKSRFSTNNTFGSMNIYVGYNFKLKKKYRPKKPVAP